MVPYNSVRGRARDALCSCRYDLREPRAPLQAAHQRCAIGAVPAQSGIQYLTYDTARRLRLATRARRCEAVRPYARAGARSDHEAGVRAVERAGSSVTTDKLRASIFHRWRRGQESRKVRLSGTDHGASRCPACGRLQSHGEEFAGRSCSSDQRNPGGDEADQPQERQENLHDG